MFGGKDRWAKEAQRAYWLPLQQTAERKREERKYALYQCRCGRIAAHPSGTLETGVPRGRRSNGLTGHNRRDDAGTAGQRLHGGKNGTVAYDGLFTFDPLASPMQVVLIYRTSANPLFLGGPRLGVFQVEADTFKWCIGAVGHSAPKELNTYPGSESVLSIYQRDPARPAGPTPSVAGGGQIHFAPLW